MRLGPDDFLLDHLGGGYALLVFGALDPQVRAEVQAWRARGLVVQVLQLVRELLSWGSGQDRIPGWPKRL